MTVEAKEQGRGADGMSRGAAWIAWSICALCVVSVLSVWLLGFLYPGLRPGGMATYLTFAFDLVLLALPAVGALVASHRPGNPIGWLFCLTALVMTTQVFADAYATYALFEYAGELPGAETTAWLSEWMAFPVVLLAAALLFLLFPEGVLLSRRWRVVVWVAVVGGGLAATGDALEPGKLGIQDSVTNPFGVEGFFLPMAQINTFGVWLLLGSCLVGAASLVLRFRWAGGVERQQIKWFASAAFVMVFGFLGAFVAAFWVPWGWLNAVAYFTGVFGFGMLPVATGIAILRYRLYDIDVIINRALVYGTLTVLLAAAYAGGVVGLQAAFRVISGQESTLAVVASTLAIAALFGPMRRRVQALVDRRFYRRKYNAAKTLAAFGVRLRDETDLDALGNDLVEVARVSVQPEYVSLWLRPEASQRGKRTN